MVLSNLPQPRPNPKSSSRHLPKLWNQLGVPQGSRPQRQLGTSKFPSLRQNPSKCLLTFDNFSKITTNSLLICTDGSKEGIRVGSGLIIFDGHNLKAPILTTNFALPPYASVYNGESEVIPEGLKIVRKIHRNSSFQAVHFYLDNQSTLFNLRNPWKTKDITIRRIYSMVKELPFTVTFTYVPAHKGHLGNELADQAAKNSANALSTLFPRRPKSSFKNVISNRCLKIMDLRWENRTLSPILKLLFPDAITLNNFIKNTSTAPLTRYLASGHYPLQNFLFSRKIVNSPICPHCETNLAETIFHRVLVCPTFSAPRVQLLLKLGYNPASTITILQSNCPDQLSALNTFLSDCKRITKTQSASKFRVHTELISNPSMEH